MADDRHGAEQEWQGRGGDAVQSVRGDFGLVLILDDEPAWLSSLERVLRPDGHRLALLADPAGVAPWLRESALDVVLLDLGLGTANGSDVLDVVARERPDVEVIVMTGSASVRSAVACMRRGAFDYLAKPFDDVGGVRRTVRSAVERRRRRAERSQAGRLTASGDPVIPLSLAAYERLALERALDETDGDATEAARRLGIGRSTLYRKLQKHGLVARTARVGRPEAIR